MNATEVVELAHEIEVWALLATLDELEAELAEARKTARGPVAGGPPVEWDAWIVALDDATFGDLLGPKDTHRTDPIPPRVAELAPMGVRCTPGKLRRLAGSWGSLA